MAWKYLIQAVEGAAYDADDLLDEILIKTFDSEFEGGQRWWTDLVGELWSYLSITSSAPTMNDIQVKLDDLLEQANSLLLTELTLRGMHLDRQVSELQTTSLQDKSHRIFGRDADTEIILKMLEESSGVNNVSVISIVGTIGVGKTTLAQLLYNHDSPFNLKMWVSVPQDFNVKTVTRAIIEAANLESTAHLQNLQPLQNKLIDLLEGKKFLLVLDNLWNENRNEWDLLLKPLQHGLKGSKIIVTTRSREVSSLVSTTEPHHLNRLSDQDCWSLLKEEALGGKGEDTILRFGAIGMKIAEKCKGLPLAAKIVGNLLKSKLLENEWIDFAESSIWELPVLRNEIVSALRSGYHHLSPHLRQCFAYCSMFPQTYNFEKDKIVQMWMGEGFIIPDKERKMIIEDIGNGYFHQLLSKSFFQMEGEKCKIHDAVHSSAQSVSTEKFFRVEGIEDLNCCRDTRHLSLVCEKIQEIILEASSRYNGLRTFLLLRVYGSPIKEIPLVLFTELRRLRVLDLSSTLIDELTGGIGNLKHLRFLDLSNTHLKWLPETMKDLCALETLRLLNCTKFLYLPESIGRLKKMRHLVLGCGKLTSMPPEIRKLTGLRSINEFIVGPESRQIVELKNLNDIRGSLCVKQLENVKNPEEAAEANLANKKYLEKLELQWSKVVNPQNDKCVLEKIMPTPIEGLQELRLKGYGGTEFPRWVSNPLFFRLASIHLSKCKHCHILPHLGELPQLKSLEVEGMDELIEVDDDFTGGGTGFQTLETLKFSNMSKLERWVVIHDGDMPHLHELAISKCVLLVNLPSLHYLRTLEKLVFEDCPELSLPEEDLSCSIKSLVITKCSKLKERCNKDDGVDWRKIKRIPYIEMDYKKVMDVNTTRNRRGA